MALNRDYFKHHLLIRATGLTFGMFAGFGLVLVLVGFQGVGAAVLVLAGVPALCYVGYEVKQGLDVLTSQRGSFGTQVVLQVLLAIALLVGVNAFALRHYARFDWTRDGVFTLAPDIQKKLRDLRGETTIVVYQRHKTFGKLSDLPDRYDYAAERKVVEKVNDLVEQLREFGASFKVVSLDVEAEGFDDKLADVTNNREDLRRAIDSAPENSIFFYTRDKDATAGKVQRLSFNAFYQLDKTASREDNESWFRITDTSKTRMRSGGVPEDVVAKLDPIRGEPFATRALFLKQMEKRLEPEERASFQDKILNYADKRAGNLVLRHHNRGVDAFTNRVLNIEAKRPKVAVLVVHELLSTREAEPYSLKGLGTALASNGFEVVDILLKRDVREPVVYTFDESKFDSFEDELKSLKGSVDDIEAELKRIAALLAKIKAGDEDALADTVAKLTVEAELRRLGGLVSIEEYNRATRQLKTRFLAALKDMKEAEKQRNVTSVRDHLEKEEKLYQEDLAKAKADQAKTSRERDALNVESATELRRMTDLTSKLKRLLADCDLVILPRFTVHTLIPPFVLPNDLHQLDRAQVEALQSFMADGKPVLACFGPPADPRPAPPMAPKPQDGFEELLAELDIRLGKQTILFKSEAKALAAAQQEFSVARVSGTVPPVQFDWTTEAMPELPGKKAEGKKSGPAPNPIRESMYLASRSVGKDLDLPIRYGRPVFYTGKDFDRLTFEPEFMVSDKRSWNEDRPFPMGKSYKPTPPKEDAPHGTLDSKGNGPFVLGVAVEKTVPASWYASKDADPAKVRVAAIGHGGLFAGPELTPVKEKLLLDSCNWLLGRGDLLASEERPDPKRGLWKFPRLVNFSDRQKSLWSLGAVIVLPFFFLYVGVLVLMVRHLR